METAVPAEAPEAQVEKIEEQVLAAFAPAEEKAPEQPAEFEQPAPEEKAYPEEDPFAKKEPLEATRRINLSDLKFGRNYKGEK